ncbi:MAG: hypothetical protein ACPGXK_12780, partial [Phycisphaerae bacterium]
LAMMRERFSGNPDISLTNEQTPVSIRQRFSVAGGALRSLYGPTKTQWEAFTIAKRDFANWKQELDTLVSKELPDLEQTLDRAGLPWTPGRSLPAIDGWGR